MKNSIAIPLRIANRGIARTRDLRESLDMSLQLLLTTSCYSCPADPHFGFILNNLRFEIFNEKEGVVYNSDWSRDDLGRIEDLYSKKISGSSKNFNTFAVKLKEAVETYEKRLGNVSASMAYIMEERSIYITIKGIILATKEEYVFKTQFNVWNY